ncbi:MAG: AraC family transcriptional regulator [Clostridia bacterium]
MILLYGLIKVRENWEVNQNTASIFTRVYCVLGGDTIYKDEKTVTKLKVNHLYCMPNLTPYQITHKKENPLECIYFHLDITPNIIDKLYEIDLSTDEILNYIIQTTKLCYKQKSADDLQLFIDKISEVLSLQLKQNGVIKELGNEISGTLEFISQNYDKKITISQISAYSGYSCEYFIKLFKKKVGISPHQYLIAYRMKIAVKLLSQGKSINEISNILTYSDTKNFSRAFKNYYGIKPSKFKYIKP